MFYVLAITPALVTLVLLALWTLKAGKHYWVFGCAALGCLLAAAMPWFCMWYAWNVLNDHTANIGAGMLAIGQPIIAPVGAVLGASLGRVFEAEFGRRGWLANKDLGRTRPKSRRSGDGQTNAS